MSGGRFFLFWMLASLGFPLGGLLAVVVAGSIEGVPSALLGGVLAGSVIGAAQYPALHGRLGVGPTWIVATALGLAVGNALGTALTGAGTSIVALVLTGLTAGAAVGLSQRAFLGNRLRRANMWPGIVAVAWPVGWTVTWAVGVDVDRGYAVFGASGALAFAAITGITMLLLTRP